MDTFRIVQVNENAYIVQELGTLFFFFQKWWTWEECSMDCSWVAYFKTKEDAMKEIEKIKEFRKRRADAKAFPRKVVWNSGGEY